jgi:hypothetical protein
MMSLVYLIITGCHILYVHLLHYVAHRAKYPNKHDGKAAENDKH